MRAWDHLADGAHPVVPVLPFPTRTPPGFVDHVYERSWAIPRSRQGVWAWLVDTRTFTGAQVPPYRVEFLPDDHGPGEFRPGVYNAHTGPFLSFAGVLGDVEPGRYRDLQYLYGSYAVSHWLFRPTRLQFALDDGPSDGECVLHLRLDTQVRRRTTRAWEALIGLFWDRFGRWCEKAVPA